ncbi:MAG: hypothetical protein VZR54_04535 [Ruminococcus sp.]|nr:hypothetical protein [Ruminococcus sp.]
MFRLPVCPHCHTVFHYGDVRKIKSKKSEKCYHCSKEFRVNRTGYIVLFAIVIVLTVFINLMILKATEDIIASTAVIFVISVAAVITALIFTPYFVRFK